MSVRTAREPPPPAGWASQQGVARQGKAWHAHGRHLGMHQGVIDSYGDKRKLCHQQLRSCFLALWFLAGGLLPRPPRLRVRLAARCSKLEHATTLLPAQFGQWCRRLSAAIEASMVVAGNVK